MGLGQFVNLEKHDGDLHILLNTNGWRVFQAIEAIRQTHGTSGRTHLLADHLRGAWQEVKAEETESIPSPVIITDDVERQRGESQAGRTGLLESGLFFTR